MKLCFKAEGGGVPIYIMGSTGFEIMNNGSFSNTFNLIVCQN